MAAAVIDLFHRSLADQDVILLIVHDHGHPPPLEIKGQLVHQPAMLLHGQVGEFQHRPVDQIPEAGLEVAVQVGIIQDLFAGMAGQVDMAFQDDPVLGQGTGLVGAEDIDGAEVLDRRQTFDDDLFLGHGQRPLGQVDGDDHRQHLRRQADRDGQTKEQGLQPVALGQSDDHEDGEDHQHHEADHQPGKGADPLVEAGLLRTPGQALRDGPEQGPGAGIHHHAPGGTAVDGGPQETGVG